MGESYTDYLNLKIKDNLKEKEWIYNIIDHLAESDDIIFEDTNIIIIPDYKWNKDKDDLHILGIFKDKKLRSIRDLNESHIEILSLSIQNGINIIKTKYNIDNLVIYFHYHPSVWQLHVHFMNTKCNSESRLIPRAHLAHILIQNLKIDTNYYKKIIL